MSTVLYIKANAKPDDASRTYKISDQFVKAYNEKNPNDNIITLDLYKENIRFLTEEDLAVVFGPKNEESKKHPILKYAYQFAEADKYIIAEPMWNLSVPAILKAYIDYVTVSGITFKYTESGPIGLLQGKKAVNIVARGGNYSTDPFKSYEMGDRYLRTILGFFGVVDFETVSAENLDVVGQNTDTIIQNAMNRAIEIAKDF